MKKERIKEALGSARVIPLPGLPSQGPLDLLRLAVEVARLQRPETNQAEEEEGQVSLTLKSTRVRELEELAALLQEQGASFTAEQLADLLLGSALSQLKTFLSALQGPQPAKS